MVFLKRVHFLKKMFVLFNYLYNQHHRINILTKFTLIISSDIYNFRLTPYNTPKKITPSSQALPIGKNQFQNRQKKPRLPRRPHPIQLALSLASLFLQRIQIHGSIIRKQIPRASPHKQQPTRHFDEFYQRLSSAKSEENRAACHWV